MELLYQETDAGALHNLWVTPGADGAKSKIC